MSNSGIYITPGKLFLWGTMIVGVIAAFKVGNMIADDGYTSVALSFGFLIGVIAVITARRHWWLPVFFVLISGFSTTAVGFKLDATDVMALFGFLCLAAMLSMGQLQAKNTQRNLGLFFYLLVGYIVLHTILYGIDNYFNGDTQFKNIAKRYYALLAPLILIWCMDLYAHPKGMRRTVNLMLLCTMLFSIVAVVLTIVQISIPGLSGVMNFNWAEVDSLEGYLRGATPTMLLLALCMSSSSPSGWAKILYRMAVVILLPAAFFGGGRMCLLVVLLYIAFWLIIRKKWKLIFAGGWALAIGLALVVIAGYAFNAQQLQNMPRSFQKVQRAMSIFLPSDQLNDAEIQTSASDEWHKDLVEGSWNYANEDWHARILGNGYKGWDDSVDMASFTYGEAYDSAVKTAVHMGASETMFFSILPILGWMGVILYYGFIIELLRRNLAVRNLCPHGTLGRSLCEFAICSLWVTLITSPVSGAIPSYGMIFWMLGFIAAEPYIQKSVRQETAPRGHLPPVFRGQLAGR